MYSKFTGDTVPTREVVRSILVAATAGLVAEIAFSFALASGVSPPLGYLLLCGALTYLAAFFVGGLCGAVVPRIPVALAIWAGANVYLSFGHLTDSRIIVPIGIMILTVLIVEPQHQNRIGPPLAVGTALVALVVIWPRSFIVLKIEAPNNIWGDISIVILYAGILVFFFLYSAARQKKSWIPSEIVFCGLLLVLLVGGASFAKQATRTRVVRSEGREPVEALAPDSKQPSIIVLVMDTVRADHLSIYGYHRDTTPALQKFLADHERATVYPLAFAPGNWTLPTHASLFTGQIPSVHGVHLDDTGSWMNFLTTTSIQADRTLAEVMRGADYRTAAIFANPVLSQYPGLERGFDVFEMPPDANRLFMLGENLRKKLFPSWFAAALKPYPSASQINTRVLEFLDESGGRPSFVVANYMEAHAPYVARNPYYGTFSEGSKAKPVFRISISDSEEQIRSAEDRYDEELLALDADIEELLREFQRRGILERSWIVITSDHGEAFGEHGTVRHMSSLYNEQVRIPLVFLPPLGTEIPSRSDAVSLIDVASTLAAIAGDRSFGIGADLRSDKTVPNAVQIEFFGADDDNAAKQGHLANIPTRAVVLGQLKLIEYPDSRELFRLGEDPNELHDLERIMSKTVLDFTVFLPPLAHGQGSETPDNQPLPLEQQERLRALGYIE